MPRYTLFVFVQYNRSVRKNHLVCETTNIDFRSYEHRISCNRILMGGWWSFFFVIVWKDWENLRDLEFRLDYKQKRIGYCFYGVSNIYYEILYDDWIERLSFKISLLIDKRLIRDRHWQLSIYIWARLVYIYIKWFKQELKLNISIVLIKVY